MIASGVDIQSRGSVRRVSWRLVSLSGGVMDRRGFLHGAAASLALAQGSPKIRAALIIEPSGDHLAHHLRAGLCAGIDEFAIADETGQTFDLTRKALGKPHISYLPRPCAPTIAYTLACYWSRIPDGVS